MRQAGTINDGQAARRLCDYLLSEGIETRANQENDGTWALWVVDEEHIETVQRELRYFHTNPENAKYQRAKRAADAIRKADAADRAIARRNFVDVRAQWAQRSVRRTPIVTAIIAIAVFVGLLTNMGETDKIGALTISSYELRDNMVYFPRVFLQDVLNGEVWRLFTPIFIHFGLWHLVFNLTMLFVLGRLVETRKGTTFLLGFVLAGAAIPNVVQLAIASPLFGGLSGVNYALFGYIWMKSRYAPHEGLHVDPLTVYILIGWFVLGLTGFGNMANGVHAAGLGFGCLMGVVKRPSHRHRRPRAG